MYWTIQFNAFRLLLFYLCRKSERSLFIPDIKHTSVRHFDAGIGNEPFFIRGCKCRWRVICDDKSMLGGRIAKTDVFSADISSVHHDLIQLTASSEKNIGVAGRGKLLVCQRAGQKEKCACSRRVCFHCEAKDLRQTYQLYQQYVMFVFLKVKTD